MQGWPQRLRRLARRALERLGLFGPVFRAIERRIARGPAGDPPAHAGPPLPPPRLMTLVTASPSYAWFIEQGREESAMLRELAARYGRPFETAGAVLDFGCGCGRLARWIAPAVVARGAAFHGADINSELVSWCRANLPGDYRRNALKPPVPIEDGSIDLLYAMSVLTHLKVRTAQAWLDDFARVLKPGGLALVSFHDEDLAPAEIRPQLAHRDWVLTAEVLEGSNHMGAFTTRDVFARVCGRRFQVLEVVPSRPAQGHQALAVLRR